MDKDETLFQDEPSAAGQQGGEAGSTAQAESQATVTRQDETQATVTGGQAGGARQAEEWDELPYEFDKCVVDLRIVLLPSDGGEGGRDVIVSATTHADDPLIIALRESELGVLPAPLAALVAQLKDALPQRGKVAGEERRKSEEDKRRAEERRKRRQPARPAASQSRAAAPQSHAAAAPLFGGGQTGEASGGATTQAGTVPTGGQQGSLFG